MDNTDLKDYIDKRLEDLKTYIDSNFSQDRKAVDQYSKTNDEWKNLHNGLQRKMEDDRGGYVTREMMNKQTIIIIAVIGLLVSLYEAFIR